MCFVLRYFCFVIVYVLFIWDDVWYCKKNMKAKKLKNFQRKAKELTKCKRKCRFQTEISPRLQMHVEEVSFQKLIPYYQMFSLIF